MEIHIKGLVFEASVGVYEWEKEKARELIADIIIEYDASKAVKSDNIEDAVDYDIIASTVVSIAKKRHYNLIESLSESVIEALFSLAFISKVKIEIVKPEAIAHVESVSVLQEKVKII